MNESKGALQTFADWFQQFPVTSVAGLMTIILIGAVLIVLVMIVHGEPARLGKRAFAWYAGLVLASFGTHHWQTTASGSWWEPVAVITFTVLAIVTTLYSVVCLVLAVLSRK